MKQSNYVRSKDYKIECTDRNSTRTAPKLIERYKLLYIICIVHLNFKLIFLESGYIQWQEPAVCIIRFRCAFNLFRIILSKDTLYNFNAEYIRKCRRR